MSEKRLIISLSPAALASGIGCLCAGFVLVFSLGVLLGRGHNLEERIPQLERIMPERATPMPPRIIAEDVTTVTTASGATPEQHAGAATSTELGIEPAAPGIAGSEANRQTGVIPPGDLAFRDNLRTPASPTRQPGSMAGATAQANQRPTAPPPTQAVLGQATPGQSVLGDSQIYHYVYQVAAYRSEAPCIAFVDRLNKAGFRARMERSESSGAIWYRAMIDFTGRPDDIDALREAMKTYGIDRLLMRSKIPAQ